MDLFSFPLSYSYSRLIRCCIRWMLYTQLSYLEFRIVPIFLCCLCKLVLDKGVRPYNWTTWLLQRGASALLLWLFHSVVKFFMWRVQKRKKVLGFLLLQSKSPCSLHTQDMPTKSLYCIGQHLQLDRRSWCKLFSQCCWSVFLYQVLHWPYVCMYTFFFFFFLRAK